MTSPETKRIAQPRPSRDDHPVSTAHPLAASGWPAATLVPWLERGLRCYARKAPWSWGKYRLVNALWKCTAGNNHAREAELIYGGYRVPSDLGEMLQRQFYFFGTYYLERHLIDVWQQLARDCLVIFDVGANAGIYSLAATAVNSKAMVHAFEPTPEIAARLRQARDWNHLDEPDHSGGCSCQRFGPCRAGAMHGRRRQRGHEFRQPRWQ